MRLIDRILNSKQTAPIDAVIPKNKNFEIKNSGKFRKTNQGEWGAKNVQAVPIIISTIVAIKRLNLTETVRRKGG